MRHPTHFGAAVTLVCALSIASVLLFAPAALAEEAMTKEQEAAMTEIFPASQAAGQLFYAGRYAEAEKAFRDVLAKTEQFFPGEALMRASALHNVAATIAEEGRNEEARVLAAEALELRQANGGVNTAIASSQALLASILRDLGRRAEASGLMQSAVTAMIGDQNANPADLIRNASRLVGMWAEDGRFAEAEQLAGDLEKLIPNLDDRQKIDVYSAIARLRSENGRLADADRNYREAYALVAKAFPDDVTRRAILVANIASILRQQFRPGDAEGLFRRAVADLETAYPAGHPALATALDGLGLSISEQNRPAEAWPIQRRALDMRVALLPDDHPLIATSLVNLGLSLLRDGQFEAARDSFRSAVTRRQAASDEVGAARAAINLAVALYALGNTGEAVKSLEEARSVFDEALPAGHPIATTAAIDEAWLLLAEGEPVKALAVARKAAAALIAARVLADDDLDARPPDEDKRRIVVAVAAAWEVAQSQ